MGEDNVMALVQKLMSEIKHYENNRGSPEETIKKIKRIVKAEQDRIRLESK